MRLLLGTIVGIFLGCMADVKDERNHELWDEQTAEPQDVVTQGITLAPEIRPAGLDSLYSRLEITKMKFFGALHLVPTADIADASAHSTAFRFSFEEGRSETKTVGRRLAVSKGGSYHVLMTIHPFEGEHSVDFSGSLIDGGATAAAAADSCGPSATSTGPALGEAAPITADDGEMEAGPLTADEGEMEAGPITADEGEMEAGPITADEGEMEAGPITADEGEMEAAPTTADGTFGNSWDETEHASTMCLWESRFAQESEFSSSSTDSFEFDLGTVTIHANDSVLILNWDMSDWMGLIMGESLGLTYTQMLQLHWLLNSMNAEEAGDQETFNPDRVRIETN